MSAVRPPAPARALHVLRLASVFEPRPGQAGAAGRFDSIGGMQTHTAALTRCLDQQGVTQTVVTSRLGAAPGRERLGEHGTVVRVGVRTPRWRQLWALTALGHVLGREHSVDVVHVHQGEDLAALPLGRLAAWRHRCPLVATVHCSVGHTVRGRSVRAILLRTVGGPVERVVLRHADTVLVLAHRTGRLLHRDGVAADRVQVVPSGFEPAVFAGDHDDPFPHVGRPRVAYVGRLVAQKQPGLVLEAFHRLTEPAHLLLVGDGPEHARLRSLAAASPLRDRIEVTGPVEHSGIPAVLTSVDVLVLPSAYEELGSVLVEAMAVGVPVVATRVGGIPEVVRDGDTGVLVPPGDVAALAGAVDALLADPERRQQMAKEARVRSARYSWPTLAGQVARLYRAAASRRRGR